MDEQHSWSGDGSVSVLHIYGLQMSEEHPLMSWSGELQQKEVAVRSVVENILDMWPESVEGMEEVYDDVTKELTKIVTRVWQARRAYYSQAGGQCCVRTEVHKMFDNEGIYTNCVLCGVENCSDNIELTQHQLDILTTDIQPCLYEKYACVYCHEVVCQYVHTHDNQ